MNADVPRYSVVMPVYQGERYVAEAIASVRAQGTDALELIVVDDGSSDGTADIVRALPGVRYLHQENGGIAAARNRGVEVAQGEYVAFLDSDDLWCPGALTARHALLEARPDAHMAFGGVEIFFDGAPTQVVRPDVQRGLLASAMLIRRSDFLRVGLFDERYRAGEFLDWYSRAEEAGLGSAYLQATVLRRRVHAHNTVRDLTLIHRCYTKILHARLVRRRAATRADD